MTPRPRVVMVNSGKAEAVDRLRRVAPEADLDVITEAAYAKQYTPDVRLHFVDDIGDLTAVRRAALELLETAPIDHVVAPSERAQQAGGYLRSYLGLPGIGYETANRFSNKAVMKAALAAAGVPLAAHRVVAGLDAVAPAAASLGWPVVVKPALGTGSMNTFAVESAEHWDSLRRSGACEGLRRADCPLLVEEFVRMDGEYHCDGVVVDGEVVFAAAQRYFVPQLGCVGILSGSCLLPDEHPDAVAMRALHDRAVCALGLRTGVTHFEAFKTGAGFLAGEIACRPAGGGIVEAVRLRSGVDLWQVFMQTSLGRPPTVLPTAPPVRGVIVNCELPIRPGRVTRISTAQELAAAVPDVLHVTMSVTAGDVIGTRLHSSSTTGLVFLAVADESLVVERVDQLAAAYVLDIEPVPEAAGR